ncbi:Uncharacterized protein APZ42_001540, partial [Daphnia magna]
VKPPLSTRSPPAPMRAVSRLEIKVALSAVPTIWVPLKVTESVPVPPVMREVFTVPPFRFRVPVVPDCTASPKTGLRNSAVPEMVSVPVALLRLPIQVTPRSAVGWGVTITRPPLMFIVPAPVSPTTKLLSPVLVQVPPVIVTLPVAPMPVLASSLRP